MSRHDLNLIRVLDGIIRRIDDDGGSSNEGEDGEFHDYEGGRWSCRLDRFCEVRQEEQGEEQTKMRDLAQEEQLHRTDVLWRDSEAGMSTTCFLCYRRIAVVIALCVKV